MRGTAQQQYTRATRPTRPHHVPPSVGGVSGLSWARVQAVEREACASPFKPLARGQCITTLGDPIKRACFGHGCGHRSHRLQRAPPAELCSLNRALSTCSTASHHLSHAPSRQRFKLKRSAPVVCLSQWPDEEWAQCSLCVHVGASACNKHPPAELCSFDMALCTYSTASYQLSHPSNLSPYAVARLAPSDVRAAQHSNM